MPTLTETTSEVETIFPVGLPKVWDLVTAVERLLSYVATRCSYLSFRIEFDLETRLLQYRESPYSDWTDMKAHASLLRAVMARIGHISDLETNTGFIAYGGKTILKRVVDSRTSFVQCEFSNHLGDFWLILTRLPDPALNGHHG